MLREIEQRLVRKGWTVTDYENEWVRTYRPHNRNVIFYITIVPEIPQALNPPLDNDLPISDDIHALVICPNGVSSSNLNQRHKKGVQFWFWDISKGNIFPSPPNTHQELIGVIIKELLSNSDSVHHNAMTSSNPITNQSYPSQFKDSLVTYSIMTIIVLMFLIMTLAGGTQNPYVLTMFGAKVNPLIQEGQIWRLFTSMFIHIGIIHLAFNLYALWILGRLCEQLFGKIRFIVIYLVSGIGGAFLSYLLSPAISAGASGAIFGILGSLLIYSLNNPQLWRSGLTGNLIAVIIANFIFGFIQPGIDNYAHFGGLLVGVILGILFFSLKGFPDFQKLTSSIREFFDGLRRN